MPLDTKNFIIKSQTKLKIKVRTRTNKLLDSKIKIPTIHTDPYPNPDIMETRSITVPILTPNGNASKDEDNSDNELPDKIISELYGDVISMIMDNDKKLVILNLNHELNSGEITIKEYRIEMFKLKTKVTDMVKKIDGLRESIKE